MSTLDELSEIRSSVLEKIKTYAEQGDVRSLTKWSKTAEQCEGLSNELRNLMERINKFRSSLLNVDDELKPPSGPVSINGVVPATTKPMSPKQFGAMIRKSWIQDLSARGIHLRGQGKNYFCESGRSVGVASANELNKANLINKWFLGLKDEPRDIIVLLCRDLEQALYDFVIPLSDLGDTWNALSRSAGEIKFHIKKQNGDFFLSIPRGQAMPLSRYSGNYDPLISTHR